MKLLEINGSNNDGLFKTENGIIWFRKYREGKGEIYRSCKTKDLNVARKRRNELMEQLWGDAPLRVKRQTFPEIWESWYQGMAEVKSKKTAESIRSAWFNLKPYMSYMFLDEVTGEWWLNEYIPKKRKEDPPKNKPKLDMSNRKFFNERKWLGMCLKFAEENGRGGPGWRRPAFKNPDSATSEGKIYSPDQLRKLRDNSNERMLTLLCMGEQHFMRRSEAIKLEWNRVSFENRSIHLRAQDTKIRRPRTFTFNRELLGHLKVLKVQAGDSAFVFPSSFQAELGVDAAMTFGEFNKLWGKTKERAGITGKWVFHWLRHTGLTKAFKQPGSAAALICHFAGLSLSEAQKTYLHYGIDDIRGVEDLVSHAPQTTRY